MAMALLLDLIEKKGQKLDDWKISSAGCWAVSGLPATSKAAEAILTLGLNLEEHRSQPVTESLLEEFKLILCMEFEHRNCLKRNFPYTAARVYLLSEMMGIEKEIDDPISLSLGVYQNTIEEIMGYLEPGFEKIVQLTK